ncbi:unnamed protein product, partial [Symbiodinium sp. CCMP2456]
EHRGPLIVDRPKLRDVSNMAVNPYSLKALEEEKLQELHDCNRMLEEQKALKKEAKAMPKAKGRAKGKAKAAPKAK